MASYGSSGPPPFVAAVAYGNSFALLRPLSRYSVLQSCICAIFHLYVYVRPGGAEYRPSRSVAGVERMGYTRGWGAMTGTRALSYNILH